MLRIAMLGGLRVYQGEQLLPPFPTHKTLSLFSYLVTFRHRYHPRDTLADLFWNGAPAAQARRNLNTTVWRLRRNLPPGYLQVKNSALAFDPTEPYWLDVAEFEAGLSQAGLGPLDTPSPPRLDIARARLALDLYQGDFLGSGPEGWALAEAERLRLLYLQTLRRMLVQYRADGEYGPALECIGRLLEADPLREDAHRQAMELYDLLGQRAAALAQFETCRNLLQDELGVAPMPETTALYERIRSNGRLIPISPAATRAARPALKPRPRTPFDPLDSPPLVGRKKEWDKIVAQLQLAAQGQGSAVLIQGEAGIGKTRLIEELVRYAEQRDYSVLCGKCRELEEPPPYLPWTEALRHIPAMASRERWSSLSPIQLAEAAVLLPEIRRFFPELPTPPAFSSAQQQTSLFEALGKLLHGLGEARPCLLLLEDLHWADRASLEALDFIARRLGATAALVVVTARPEKVRAWPEELLGKMEQEGALQPIFLQRLSAEDTARLAAEMLDWPAPDVGLTTPLYVETQGNPFFITEVLRGLYEQGLLVREESGQWKTMWTEQAIQNPAWQLPQGIRLAIHRRLEQLDTRTRYLLDIAAVLGNEFDLELLQRVSGWKKETILLATDNLLRRQLLLETECLCFSHDKIRQVIYEEMDRGTRRALHLRAGAVLARLTPEQTEELANHFYQGQDDRRALPYCLEAGRHARHVHANQSALSYLTWAVEAAERSGPTENRQVLLEAYEARGQVYEFIGSYSQALADYAAMEGLAEAAGDRPALARAIRRQAWVWGERMGQWEKGLRGGYEALRIAREAGSQREATVALLDIGALHNMRGEHIQALDSLRASLAAAEEAEDPGARAASLQYLAVTYQFLSRYEEGVAAFREAFRTWSQIGNRRAAAKTLADMGFLQINWGALSEAEQALQQAVEELVAIEAMGALPFVRIGLAAVERYTGRCTECLQTLQAIELGLLPGDSPFVQALIHYHRGWALWDQGQAGPALAELQRGLLLARQNGSPTQIASFLGTLGRCHRCLGQIQTSRRYLQEALDLNHQAAFTSGEAAALADLGLALVKQGEVDQGWLSLTEAARLARPLGPLPCGEVSAALVEGALAMGARPACLRLARRALALAEGVGLRPLQVQANLLLGRALAGLGHMSEAEKALRQALRETEPPGYPMQRWLILLVLANVLIEMGRTEEAAQARTQAVDTVQFVLANIDNETLRTSFLSQPPVQYLLGLPLSSRQDQLAVPVARLGVPGGRPLHPDEWVTVPFTPTLPAAGAADRRRALLRLVEEAWLLGGCPSEADLGTALGVSTRTIRSDIAALRRKGYAVRTRGGRGQKSGIRNQKSGIRNQKTGNREQETENRKQRTENRKQKGGFLEKQCPA